MLFPLLAFSPSVFFVSSNKLTLKGSPPPPVIVLVLPVAFQLYWVLEPVKEPALSLLRTSLVN